jgi:hypothetical protein
MLFCKARFVERESCGRQTRVEYHKIQTNDVKGSIERASRIFKYVFSVCVCFGSECWDKSEKKRKVSVLA